MTKCDILAEAITRIIEEAKKEEREACASLAEHMSDEIGSWIAEAIRARGQ